MATSTPICGICDHRHISKPSVIWCSECNEGFCNDCGEHHGVAKATRNHNTTPIFEYHKLPTNVINISQFCSEHNEKYLIYCKKHDCVCCRRCVIETHNNCQEISVLDDVIRDVKTSSAFHEIEQKFTELSENIQRIHTDRQENLTSLKVQRKMIEREIHQTRLKINRRLDKIQEDLVTKLTAAEEEVTQKIQTLVTSLERNGNKIKELQINLSNIKQHASDLQAFLSMKEMEQDAETLDTFIASLKDNGSLNRTTLSRKIEMTLLNISNIGRFGEVLVEIGQRDVKFFRSKDKEAQIMVHNLPTRTIRNMYLELKQIINTGLSNCTSCLLLPAGKMAFAQFRECIVVFNADKANGFEVDTNQDAFDIAYIEKSNILAVTSGYGLTSPITVIDIKRRKICKQIPINTQSDGIIVRNNTLLYCARARGIRMVNMDNDSVTDMITGEKSGWCYLSSFGDLLYYTNKDRNTVTCCDLKGNKKWEFEDESVLKYPLGISTDNDGNVYVVGHNTHNMVVISPDGQQNEQLLSYKDGLNYPRGIHYDRSTNRLLVANGTDKAFLYGVNAN